MPALLISWGLGVCAFLSKSLPLHAQRVEPERLVGVFRLKSRYDVATWLIRAMGSPFVGLGVRLALRSRR